MRNQFNKQTQRAHFPSAVKSVDVKCSGTLSFPDGNDRLQLCIDTRVDLCSRRVVKCYSVRDEENGFISHDLDLLPFIRFHFSTAGGTRLRRMRISVVGLL